MRNALETVIGAIILVAAVMFFISAYHYANTHIDGHSYRVLAKFDHVDGIFVGAEVRIGGIRVGEVSHAMLDPHSYQAVITMRIQEDIRLPIDSSAQITSDGLLAGKVVTLVPGAEDVMIPDQGEISFTQSSVNIEALIGKMIFKNNGS